MKGKIVYLLFIAVLFSACSLFQGDSFSGPWKMTWTSDNGDEEWEFVVEEDNSFKFDHTFFMQGNPLPIDFKGNVGDDGELKGDIYLEGQVVGSFNGKCDYEKGEGAWRGGNYSGSWSVVKL